MAPRDRETDTHSNLVGGRERDGLHLTIRHTGLSFSLSSLSSLALSLSTPRSPVSSLSHRCLPQWYSIDLLSLSAWQERKDAPRGDGKDIEPPRNEGGRREESEKDVINVTELLVCRRRRHAVTRRRTEARWPFIYRERERVDQQHRTEGSRLVVCDGNKLVWEVKRWAGTRSHFQHSEFPRSFVNENKADELLSVRDETPGSALLSPRQHIDSEN